MLIFLMDFWEQGVKEFIIENTNKRNVDAQIAHIAKQEPGITLTDITLAEARRLLEEALAVNKWRGTPPHKEYRHHLPTVRQLILDATDVGEDRGYTFIDPKLDPDEVITTFVIAWTLGDFGLVYDLLTNDSSIREDLSRDEWIERHHQWANEAHPTRFELGFVHEREQPQSALWVPSSIMSIGGSQGSRKEVEIGWSVELTDTQLSGTLSEMPMGTAVFKETGRHWFWTSYTLVQGNEQWRISKMTDEGANAQGLPIAELQKRVQEEDTYLNEIIQKQQARQSLDVPNPEEFVQDTLRRVTQALHYEDALLVKLPLDRTIYENAYNHATAISAIERSMVYLEGMAHRFPENRTAAIRQLGTLYATLSDYYKQRGMDERSARFLELAEFSLRESLSMDNAPLGYALLAELFLTHDMNLDEAETLLHQAKELSPTRPEEAIIEAALGKIAALRNQPEEELRYFQRAAELSPDYPGIWYGIATIQDQLGQYAEAEQSFKNSIDRENDIRSYIGLTHIYVQHKQFDQARAFLEQSLRTVKDRRDLAYIHALLASVFIESGDRRRAQEMLDEADRIAPGLEVVKAMREDLQALR
jgi:tetratricopeptide (TPR) repeat protein